MRGINISMHKIIREKEERKKNRNRQLNYILNRYISKVKLMQNKKEIKSKMCTCLNHIKH